eukprot:2189858-Amphidinium_carterae.1
MTSVHTEGKLAAIAADLRLHSEKEQRREAPVVVQPAARHEGEALRPLIEETTAHIDTVQEKVEEQAQAGFFEQQKIWMLGGTMHWGLRSSRMHS